MVSIENDGQQNGDLFSLPLAQTTMTGSVYLTISLTGSSVKFL